MIEVIKNNARKEFECSYCKSIIAYDPIDIRERGTFCSWCSFVRCPVCDEEYVFEKVDALVPKNVVIENTGDFHNVYNCPKCGKEYSYEKKGVIYWRDKTPFTCECGEKIYIGD